MYSNLFKMLIARRLFIYGHKSEAAISKVNRLFSKPVRAPAGEFLVIRSTVHCYANNTDLLMLRSSNWYQRQLIFMKFLWRNLELERVKCIWISSSSGTFDASIVYGILISSSWYVECVCVCACMIQKC